MTALVSNFVVWSRLSILQPYRILPYSIRPYTIRPYTIRFFGRILRYGTVRYTAVTLGRIRYGRNLKMSPRAIVNRRYGFFFFA